MCIKQRVLGVIPARYDSSRLPGKPLLEICGMPMIAHTFLRAKQSRFLDEVIIATDDLRIYDEIKKYGAKVMMTHKSHQNGTERMCEIAQKEEADIYVLINGDEALLNPLHIDEAIFYMQKQNNQKIETLILYNKFYKRNSPSDFKILLDKYGRVIYISRSDIPSEARNSAPFLYKAYHIMLFTRERLNLYKTLKQTLYDQIESHELLRLIENGYQIYGLEVESSAISVDTFDDLEYVRSVMYEDRLFLHYQ